MITNRAMRPLWWILLAWVSLVYLEGLTYVTGGPSSGVCQSSLCTAITDTVSPVAAFTGLVLVFGALLSVAFVTTVQPAGRWLLLLAQWSIVFGISQVVAQDKLVLSLCLAITLEAIVLLGQPVLVSIAAAGSIVLYIGTALSSIGAWSGGLVARSGWASLWNVLVLKTDFADLLLFTASYLVFYVLQTRTQGQRDAAYTELEAANADLATAHAELMASREEIEELTRLTERQRLARDLHDTLIQGLAGVILQLEVASAHQAKQNHPRATEIVHGAIERARVALGESRAAIADLRAGPRGRGDFTSDIQEDIDRFGSATGIVCDVNLGGLAAIPAPIADQVRRALGEVLANVARHAHARHVWIGTSLCEDTVAVEVHDDGVGFDLGATKPDGHYGLLGLSERTQLAGGDVAVTSTQGKGTTVRFRFPSERAGGRG